MTTDINSTPCINNSLDFNYGVSNQFVKNYQIPYFGGTDHVITYNELMQTQDMAMQLSDRFFYVSLILLGYVLLNMFVFYENSRFRNKFDELDKYQIPYVGSIRDLLFQITKSFAFAGSLMLVMLNIIYRMGLNI